MVTASPYLPSEVDRKNPSELDQVNDWELTEDEKEKLSDQWWRLTHLYYIIDPDGKKIRFKPNWAQRLLFHGMWFRNVILKARQLGMSTFIQILMLDTCLFTSNIKGAVIAHGQKEAKEMFRDKIKFAYDNLPDDIKKERPAKNDSAQELVFSNGSSIVVSTSIRSGTPQFLHISEFGKICYKYPDRAREIMSGSIRAAHQNAWIFVESTAEGREGRFFDMCEDALKLQSMGKQPNKLEFKLWFLPWWKHPKNVLDPKGVIIFPSLRDYFKELEINEGIKLTNGQKAWYVAQVKLSGEDIKREDPSTYAEAFENIIEGAYFKSQFSSIRKEKRITKVPWQQGIEVDTWWDIGLNDTTCIWFTQTVGTAIHIIDYVEWSGEGMAYYKRILDDKSIEHGYHYGRHVWPHDGGHGEWGSGKTRFQQALEMGLRVEVASRSLDKQDDIEAVRNILSICWFDEEKCETLVKAEGKERNVGVPSLESYRREYDDRLGAWRRTPLHNWASNGADAFMTLACNHQYFQQRKAMTQSRAVKKKSSKGWT